MSASLTRIKYLLPKYTRGKVLQVGVGDKAYPHFTEVDDGPWLDIASESVDSIFAPCEQITSEDMDEWTRVVKTGGYICVCGSSVVDLLSKSQYNWEEIVNELCVVCDRQYLFQVFKRV